MKHPVYFRFVSVISLRQLGLAVLLAGALGGCDPVSLGIGVGAATGVGVYEERGLKGVARDTAVEARILKLWLADKPEIAARLSVEVYENRVLITGVVPTEEMRAAAIGMAWKADGVKDVLNEVVVGEPSGFGEIAQDTAITAELKSKLTFDDEVHAVNYAVETVRGTVYLIGIAQSQAELDRVIARARNISYVKKVISHVRIKAAE